MQGSLPSHRSNSSDAELVAAYQQGDESAFRPLVERYVGPLYAFAYRYVGTAADAEDVVQEAFVRAWRHFGKFDAARSFKTWLYAIARNVALDFLKKKKAIPFSGLDDEEEQSNSLGSAVDPAPLPDEVFSRVELTAEIDAALDGLPLSHRTVLHLHYSDQLTFREIAEVLGEPLDTVKSRHRRGLLRLRELLLSPDVHQNQRPARTI